MEANQRVLIAFGTRPEWIKIKPVIEHLERGEYELLFTGQQEDLVSGIEVDHRITIQKGNNRLNDILAGCITQFPVTSANRVLVQGDTASVLGIALAAFNYKKKVIYLEAGLRTYDLENPYPEEGYRQMIARIADVNLCPTDISKENLINEKVNGKIHVVGNTVLDNLLKYKVEASYDNHVLVTLHRRENHDKMEAWFTALDKVAQRLPTLKFILPIHPNPNVLKHRDLLKNVEVINPLPHEELIKLMRNSRFIITDSGGLQEEGAFFNKKVIVCRETTERPEGIKTGHLLLCKSPTLLNEMAEQVVNDFEVNEKCPYGDGFSGSRVAQIIREFS